MPDAPSPPDATGDPSRGVGAEPLLERVRRRPPSPPASGTTAAAHLASLAVPFRSLIDASGPVTPRLLDEAAGPGYTRQRWELGAYPGMPFAAYVLRPHRAAPGAPTVLALHGHGYGSRQLVGLTEDGGTDPDRSDGHGHFAESLAALGANVVVPDVVGFGQRRSAADTAPDEPSACARLTRHLAFAGLSLAGARLAELTAVLDSLAGLGLDPGAPLGAAGHSGGSLLASCLGLVDHRVRAVALSAYANTYAQSILAMRHCPCNYVPGLARTGEMPDVLAGLAPRPLLIETGRADRIFPLAGFRAAAASLERAYGAGGALTVAEHDGGHRVDGRVIHPRLVEHLAGAR
ncbi:alpha/beta hydrolase family protein [Zhihengliuella salsuginis]|uniref:Alpha/beta hydrolase family protein n=1 Tax=Zhihengliuella salsuginis TaxID=578222 RepID=A0ABQ3GBR5_9MICC|nr:dienelactone hydrolase [Zhihengliuella salsuginis]GHC99688.1 hypothetical protein GCM10008096_02110 [Zhihengliuella salsuginis]